MWVVAKLGFAGTDYPVVEEQGYWLKEKASARAEHLRAQDNTPAWVYPVRFWNPLPTPSVAPAPEYPPLIVGAVTAGPGLEMNAYANLNGGPPLRMADESLHLVVSRVWDAWRLQQAGVGNLLEAGQEPPAAALRSLLEDVPGAYRQAAAPAQLELPFPAPV